jgi:hypothetical protein
LLIGLLIWKLKNVRDCGILIWLTQSQPVYS